MTVYYLGSIQETNLFWIHNLKILKIKLELNCKVKHFKSHVATFNSRITSTQLVKSI